MANKNRIRPLAKRAMRKSLVTSKKVLSKSKTVKKGGRFVRDIIFPNVSVNIYDYSRYSPSIADYQKQLKLQEEFKVRPLISIVMPTYNTDITYLEECIESVLLQSYPEWELCIADDASTNKEVVQTLQKYANIDSRIKYVARKENGHISIATNSAIELATGEFIALLDHDDVLWPNALYEIVKVINNDPSVDFIYSDEDKIDEFSKIHSYPFLKPDWSPEFLESCNYITHFSCIRTKLLRSVDGLRKGYEGAQDWDLFLRITEKTDRVVHIPKILYSWRIHEASTASDTDAKPYVYEAQRKLLVDHIERSSRRGLVKQGIIKQHSCVEYSVENDPKVSVIIIGRRMDSLKNSIGSLIKNTGYKNIELIIVAKSQREASFAIKLANKRFDVSAVACDDDEAVSLMKGVQKASGDFLVFLDGGMKIKTQNWVELLLGDAQREDIGVVGGRTTTRDEDKFMRAGVGMGIYGFYAPLLEWMSLDDIHYMRGLYAQSRRNVAAIDGGCVMVKAERFEKVGGLTEGLGDTYIIDLCLKFLQAGMRNIYNPFVSTTDLYNLSAGDKSLQREPDVALAFKSRWSQYIEYDPYLNPSFSRTDAQLDIK